MRAARTGAGARALGRTAAAAAAVVAALAAPAFAQAPPVTPQDFVNAAGGADQYEIMAAHVALIESHDSGVRSFAQDMVREHTAASAALADAATRSGLKPPPPTVGTDQAPLLAALQGARGAEFDRRYVHQQVLDHRAALVIEGSYARNGSDTNLRAAAQADLQMIQHHLEEAQQLRLPPD